MMNEPDPGKMVYGYSIGNSGTVMDVPGNASEFTIQGLTAAETDVKIYHRYSNDPSFASDSLVLPVKAWTKDSVMTLEETDSGLAVTGIPEGSSIRLVNAATGHELAGKSDVSGTSYTFKAAGFSEFDTGIFQVIASSSDGDAVSNSLDYTTPIKLSSSKEGRQHYWASIPVSSGINADEVFSIGITGYPNADIEISSSGDITISGLPSNTPITGYIRGGDQSYLLDFTTDDFVGTYIFYDADAFNKNMDKFAVYVGLAPEESDCMYYFYASTENDKPYKPSSDTSLRLCPLIDPEIDTLPSGNGYIPYEGTTSYQMAYQWNNEKWNSMASIMSPSEWKITDFSVDNAIDSYTATVESVALGTTNKTKTDFRFIESSDSHNPEVFLVFYNQIVEGSIIGNSFTYTNREPDSILEGLYPNTVSSGFTSYKAKDYAFKLTLQEAN